jgi:hypothetical protein
LTLTHLPPELFWAVHLILNPGTFLTFFRRAADCILVAALPCALVGMFAEVDTSCRFVNNMGTKKGRAAQFWVLVLEKILGHSIQVLSATF